MERNGRLEIPGAQRLAWPRPRIQVDELNDFAKPGGTGARLCYHSSRAVRQTVAVIAVAGTLVAAAVPAAVKGVKTYVQRRIRVLTPFKVVAERFAGACCHVAVTTGRRRACVQDLTPLVRGRRSFAVARLPAAPRVLCVARSVAAVLGVGLVVLGSSGCGSSPRSTAPLPLARWLSVDTAKKRVMVRLLAAYNGVYGGFNFNGYGKGQVLVDIPKGWRVRVSCTDGSSSLSHSCAIVRGVGTTALAFPGSASPRAQAGLSPHHSTTFSFVAAHVGSFRIACLVAGHELAGMWDVLDVSHRRLPSVTLLRRLPP
jgi:hypothetical protein